MLHHFCPDSPRAGQEKVQVLTVLYPNSITSHAANTSFCNTICHKTQKLASVKFQGKKTALPSSAWSPTPGSDGSAARLEPRKPTAGTPTAGAPCDLPPTTAATIRNLILQTQSLVSNTKSCPALCKVRPDPFLSLILLPR